MSFLLLMIQEYMFVKQVASQSYTTGHPLGKANSEDRDPPLGTM